MFPCGFSTSKTILASTYFTEFYFQEFILKKIPTNDWAVFLLENYISISIHIKSLLIYT